MATRPQSLTREEAREAAAVIGVRGVSTELLSASASARDAAFGNVVTYSPKVFIPLTKACRDVCHYCTFAAPPRHGEPIYMTTEEVVEIARLGAAAGCHEALFTLGDRPEGRYREARQELDRLGHTSTLSYLKEAAEAVLSETGLLPHLNPGVMSLDEIASLREVSASMGMMLESSSKRLMEKGMPHHGSPDKDPEVRRATLDFAGRAGVPFTTGLLIGIGETWIERAETLLAIRESHERWGHIQEVIVQNFRAKPGTLMKDHAEPALPEMIGTIVLARLILPPEISVQAPPNLAGNEDELHRYLEAGINDWGGISPVTIDHVNPEAPWPEIERLGNVTGAAGFVLVPRLTVYPRFAFGERWLHRTVRRSVLALAATDGLAFEGSWWAGAPVDPPSPRPPRVGSLRERRDFEAALEAAAEPRELDETEITVLFSARGPEMDRLLALADRRRREINGDAVTYVVNRNINYTNMCYFRCGFCAFSKGPKSLNLRGEPYLLSFQEIEDRCAEAWEKGATEVCLQGGIHPSFTGDYYLQVVRTIKAAVPRIHIHAFSPLEIWQGAETKEVSVRDLLWELKDEGLGTLPGTAAEILDDEVRAVICPDKINTEQWCFVARTAHSLGLPMTTTMMFGHADTYRSWARHLIVLRELQRETGGFTEFVPLPFVHMGAPIYLRGRARKGPTFDEAMKVHAVARLALHPWITNIQTSWVKMGPKAARAALDAGCNDLGGTLMNESISRAAGASHGQELTEERMREIIASASRTPVRRNTVYEVLDYSRV